MADAPWQCPQCGTINEPVANSCRSCGRWPSLFDLERGAVPTTATVEEAWAHRPIEVDELHPEVSIEPELDLEPVGAEPVTTEPVFDADEEEAGQAGRGKLVRSLIVPIAFAIYIVISIIFGDRGSSS
jgi:hypothetical protein